MFDPWNWPTPPDAWANVGELVAFNSLLYDHYDRNAVFFHSKKYDPDTLVRLKNDMITKGV